MVLVIVSILAAIAVPKMADNSSNARSAALASIANALTSASHANLLARQAGPPTALIINQSNLCSNPQTLKLLEGGLPSGYALFGAGDCSIVPGYPVPDSAYCALQSPGGGSRSLLIFCAQ